jgi:hypothetical protein
MPLILPGNVASATAAGYDVANSCRFNEPDDPSMLKTSGSGNQRTFTVSVWLKRSKISSFMAFYSQVTDDNNYFMMNFQGSDKLDIHDLSGGVEQLNFRTTAVFRDVSAWYHIVVAVDTTQATEGNRFKLWVNGTQQTVFDNNTYPDQNDDIDVNVSGEKTRVGAGYDTANYHFDGYLAEVCSIDATAYTASDFGEFDEDSPTIWKPKDVSGLTFGTNGFYLDFEASDNLGNDANGGTDLTESNLAAADQMVDTPTNNFPTGSPIFEWYYTDNIAMAALSEGNLQMNATSDQVQFCKVPFDMTGKVYFEVMPITQQYQVMGFGEPLYNGNSSPTDSAGNNTDGINVYVSTGTENIATRVSGVLTNVSDAITVSAGSVLQFAYDADTGKAWVGVDNTWYNSGDPANGTNDTCTFPASTRDNMQPAGSDYGTGQGFVWNFGQDSSFAGVKTAQGNQDGNDIGDFYYAPPSGFLALCSKNRSDTTIDNPELYFQTKTYTGDGSTPSITLDGDEDMQPDVVWIKNRDQTDSHCWFDSVRGATKLLYPDTTDDEEDDADTLTSFDSDGFALGDDDKVNTNTEAYVAWCWKESATAGFDIVSYTGTGSARDISHSLSALPDRIMVKTRDLSGPDWIIWGDKIHTTPHDALMKLNNQTALSTGLNSSWFNDTNPTTSVFSVGTQGDLNGDGNTYIAYLWTSIQGFSKFGSYTGNGNADGPFIYTGFRPAFVMHKQQTDANTPWMIWDNKRDTFNETGQLLYPDSSLAEADDANPIDILSNGFKLRTSGSYNNDSGNVITYMAFAEAPFVNSNGVPCNAR